MNRFQVLQPVENIREIINQTFNIDFDIEGDWGYSKERALVINGLAMPKEQFEHTFAMMRSNIVMSLLPSEEEKYGSINVVEQSRKRVDEENIHYDVIGYKISAMLQSVHAKFIKEYKKMYGKEEFDMQRHFEEREEETFFFEEEFWFRLNIKE
jgi:hypothetical protein